MLLLLTQTVTRSSGSGVKVYRSSFMRAWNVSGAVPECSGMEGNLCVSVRLTYFDAGKNFGNYACVML